MTAKHRLPADVRPEQITAVIDSREQHPLDLQPLRVVTAGLATGDYSVRGLERVVAIERKSLSDLVACVGAQRDRFDREVMRMLAYPVRACGVGASWPDREAGQGRSKVTAAAAVGSCLGWIATGVPIVMVGDHERCGRFVARLLFLAARRRWRESRAFADHVAGLKDGGREGVAQWTGRHL